LPPCWITPALRPGLRPPRALRPLALTMGAPHPTGVSGGPMRAAGMPGGAKVSGGWQAPEAGPRGMAGLSGRRTLMAEVPGGGG
jgi:hypothetical protein